MEVKVQFGVEFWHPSGVHFVLRWLPEVFATLRPPATIWQPFGLLRNANLEGWKIVAGG